MKFINGLFPVYPNLLIVTDFFYRYVIFCRPDSKAFLENWSARIGIQTAMLAVSTVHSFRLLDGKDGDGDLDRPR